MRKRQRGRIAKSLEFVALPPRLSRVRLRSRLPAQVPARPVPRDDDFDDTDTDIEQPDPDALSGRRPRRAAVDVPHAGAVALRRSPGLPSRGAAGPPDRDQGHRRRPPAGEDDLGPLVESVRALGVVQPLLVRRRKGRYELIAGARRLAAAAAAGPHRGAVPAPGRRRRAGARARRGREPARRA